jgi:hypothetical protein
MTDNDDDVVHRVLSTVFTNPNFRQSKFSQFMLYGVEEGKKFGIVISSKDPPQYPSYILNKLSVERLISTKNNGKIDGAFVVLAQREGATFKYLGHLDATSLYQQLQDVRPFFGKSGLEYWILPPSITGEVDGDPF